MAATAVAILAQSAEHRDIAKEAADYLNRGTLVTATVVSDLVETKFDLSVGFVQGDGADLHIVDEQGLDWDRGFTTAVLLSRGGSSVRVCLVDAGRSGSTGRVSMLRSVAASVAAGHRVLGPLIAMYVSGRTTRLEQPSRVPPVAAAQANRRGRIRFLGRLARAILTVRNWQVGHVQVDLDRLVSGRQLIGRVHWRGPTRRAFWADPCIFDDGHTTWLFVEDLSRRSGLGRIRGLQVSGEYLSQSRILLQTEHHLSFPQIYRVPGRWLATVETCAAQNPIYTFDHLGEPWRPADDLPAMPAGLADAVVRFDDSGQPESATGTDASLDPDSVFVKWDLRDGKWQRDDTAIFVDVHSARGGGTDDDARGYRAVQDCAGTYGSALMVVDDLGEQRLRLTGPDVASVW